MILNFHKLQYLLGFLSNERYVNLGEKREQRSTP